MLLGQLQQLELDHVRGYWLEVGRTTHRAASFRRLLIEPVFFPGTKTCPGSSSVGSRITSRPRLRTSLTDNRDDPKARFVCYEVVNHSSRFLDDIGQDE